MNPNLETLTLEAYLGVFYPNWRSEKRKRWALAPFVAAWPTLTTDPPVGEITEEQIGLACKMLLEGNKQTRVEEGRYLVRAALRSVRPERFRERHERRAKELQFTREPAKVYLVDCVDAYARVRLATKTPAAKGHHLHALSQFRKFLEHEPTTADLTDENYSTWVAWLLDIGLSRDTASGYSARLLCLWNYCARKRLVEEFTEHQKLKPPKRTPQAWTREQLITLWEALKTQKGPVGRFSRVPARLFWVALHCVGWDTGERLSAMLAIRWEWIDLQSGWLTIPAEYRKGKEADKTWELHPETVAVLKELRKHSATEAVFALPFNQKALWERYKAILASAGLPTGRKHLFHKWRRTVASFFEAAGGNSTALLGHSSRAVTELYLDPRIVKPQQACAVLFRPGDAPAPVQAESSIDADVAAAIKLLASKLK